MRLRHLVSFTQIGFSLIELMLALLLSALLMVGVTGIYKTMQATFKSIQVQAKYSETVRFLTHNLHENIGLAGFAGCGNIDQLNLHNAIGQDFSLASSLRGYTSTNVPQYLVGNVVPNTDVVVIKKATTAPSIVIKPIDVGATSIISEQNPATDNNTLLLVSDCKNADLVQAQNSLGNYIQLKPGESIQHAYSAYAKDDKDEFKDGIASIARYEEIAYFVSTADDYNDNGKPVYGLYIMTNRGNKEVLVEGINSMLVKYGIPSVSANGPAFNYFTADELKDSDWQKVISVVFTFGYAEHFIPKQTWNVYIKLEERA